MNLWADLIVDKCGDPAPLAFSLLRSAKYLVCAAGCVEMNAE
jgi:hypothetical protein